MKSFTLTLTLIFLHSATLALGYRFNSSRASGRPTGNFAPRMLVGQDELGRDPAQEFLCGFQLGAKEWAFTVKEASAGPKRLTRRPAPVVHKNNNMTNRIKVIFCNYVQWEKQIERLFQSGDKSKSSMGWREKVMCPNGTYASGISPRFSARGNSDLGMTGLKLICSDPSFTKSQQVQDSTGLSPEKVMQGGKGKFISGIKIKSERASKLTGIIAGFESMPVIAGFDFSYDIPKDIKFQPIDVGSATAENRDVQPMPKLLRVEKELKFVNTWNLTKKYVEKYQRSLSNSSTPNYFPNPSSENLQTLSTFAFNKEIPSTVQILNETKLLLPSCSSSTLKQTLYKKQTELPYKVTVIFVSQYDRTPLANATYVGVWRGVLVGRSQGVLEQAAIKDCGSKEQDLRTSGGN